MHLGFSSMNTPIDPAPTTLAPMLEQAGFESLWYGEHSHIPRCRRTAYPGGGELPEPYKAMMDPYVSLMAAAGVTDSLKLGTGIALLMERELFSQAKTIVTLERLTHGRLMIGTGVGWNEEEFENASAHPFKKRYAVMRETVAATRALMTQDTPEFHGEYIDFDSVWFEPKPSCVPQITFGAMGPLGIHHAAQWADGWMPVDMAMPDIPLAITDFKRQVQAFGRNPDDVEITLVVMNPVTEDLLYRYRDYGITRCNVGIRADQWNKPEMIEPLINQCAKIIPNL